MEREDAWRGLGGTLSFLRVLWAVDHELRSASKVMGARLGVTGPQRLVLRLLGRLGSIGAGDLAAVMMIHPSTLTGVLRRLDRQGLVKREPGEIDGRRVRLTLTRRGRAFDRGHPAPIEETVKRSLARLPARHVLAARRVLACIARDLRGQSGPGVRIRSAEGDE